MAISAAEMKARLVKYAAARTTPAAVIPASTVTEPDTSIAATAASPLPETPVRELDGVSSSDSAGRPEQSSGATVVQLSEVVTELQPTTLVVVERPASVENNSSIGGSATEASNESQTNLDTTNPIHLEFLQRLGDLETALLNRDPLMKTHLGAIHKAMIQYEELPNLLTTDEIAKIMKAQQAHTGIVLRQETVGKSKAAAAKKAAGIGLSDV